MIGDNKTNLSHKLLLTIRQVADLRKASVNYLSTDIKLSKTQLSKKIQSGEFLGRLLGPLLKTGLTLIKNVIKPLAKSVLGSGNTTTLIISNDEMNDVIKIVNYLEDSGLLLKGVIGTVQNEVKEQNGKFLSKLFLNIKSKFIRKHFNKSRDK